MSPLATGCQAGPVPTQGSVPGPLATRSLKAGVWARSLSPPTHPPPPTTLLVQSSFSCFSRCRSHSHFIHLKLSVWGSYLPDVLPLCCLCTLPSQPFFPLLSIFLYQNYTMQRKLMQVCTPTSMRFSKLVHLMGRQTAAPRGVGMDVRLFRPRQRKQVRNCNSKNSASLFSLMRDNKQANSTAYG